MRDSLFCRGVELEALFEWCYPGIPSDPNLTADAERTLDSDRLELL